MWVMPLGSSFWVDEAETAFVVHHGSNHPSLAIIAPAIESVYYWLPRASEAIFGFSEAAERLPSLRGVGDRAVLHRASRRPADSSASRLVCGIRVPHAAALQLRSRRRAGLRSGNLRGGGESVASDPLARFRADGSTEFCSSRPARCSGECIWSTGRSTSCTRFISWRDRTGKRHGFKSSTICAGLVLALLPVAIQRAGDEPGRRAARFRAAAFLVRTRGNVQDPPGRWRARSGAWILAALAALARVDSAPSLSAIALIAGWWLVQPIGLFAYSHLSGVSVFTTRYVSIALPGAALAATAAAAFFIPKSKWQSLALVMGIAALIFGGQWSKLWPPHHNSDWRGASRAANALALGLVHAGVGRQPVRRSQAAGLEPGLSAPGISVLPAGRVSGQRHALLCFPMAIRPRESSMPRLSRRARCRLPGDS